jgi:carbon starvation protein
MAYPMYFVILALIAYGVAYFIYGKWYDRRVWQPDVRRTTPAHMYTDGVEYFPVSRAVLWGYQFKSVAALGPILGPFIALTYGWLPALIWILLGNFFIGWLQDYGAIMVSVRNEGRSFGPITYEFTGASGRNTLLGFVLLYLLIISATFLFFIATFWNVFPSTFVATLGVFATGILVGHLLYRRRMGVGPVTLLALVLVVVSILLGMQLRTATNFLGVWTIPFWAAVCCVILYLASILPLPTFIQPINYVSFFPAFLAIIVILFASLISPITNVPIQQAAFKTLFSDGVGPIWPILFVAIACGAISGWHSLVSSSTTSKQLDVEIDAHSVGAGAMLSEGLLALASVAAYTVLSPQELTGITNISAWVNGAVKLTSPFLGGTASASILQTYFGLTLVIYALTVQALVTRFWRLVAAETVGETSFAVLGQKHVATVVGLVIPLIFASTGSWINLWLYFGGANQLLAGLAIMLITIHLARVRQPTLYTLIPATFMIVTTLSALIWQTWAFSRPLLTALGILQGYKPLIQAGTPLADPSLTGLALVLNSIFVLVGLALIWLGVRMALLTYDAYGRYRTGGQQPVARPAPA